MDTKRGGAHRVGARWRLRRGSSGAEDHDVKCSPAGVGALVVAYDPDAEALTGLGGTIALAVNGEVGVAEAGQVGQGGAEVDVSIGMVVGHTARRAGRGGGDDVEIGLEVVSGVHEGQGEFALAVPGFDALTGEDARGRRRGRAAEDGPPGPEIGEIDVFEELVAFAVVLVLRSVASGQVSLHALVGGEFAVPSLDEAAVEVQGGPLGGGGGAAFAARLGLGPGLTHERRAGGKEAGV